PTPEERIALEPNPSIVPRFRLSEMDIEFRGRIPCEPARALTVEQPEVDGFGELTLVLRHVFRVLLEKARRSLAVNIDALVVRLEKLWLSGHDGRHSEFDL